MPSSMFGYFGLGTKANPVPAAVEAGKKITTAPIRALPAPWYTSQDMYEFERRAVFSRRWLFMTHQSRLANSGDFLRFNVAGFDLIIVRDRKGSVNAFHNVCRHRAYPFMEKTEGNAKIFACRYHGWSYGLDGKLAKAPDYDLLQGFDKSRNGLLPIHTYVDVNGFVWINLDSSAEPEVPWTEHFDGVDQQERFKDFNFDDYVLDHTYELDGSYNWKILADNFNECYHCATTHPDVPAFLSIDSHDCEGKAGHIQHDQAPTAEQKAQGFNVNSTYYFPNVSMSISPHFMMIQKFLPSGASSCRMHYEVYRNKNSADKDFKLIADMYARVMSEDKVLCERAQKNLNAGVIMNGELHPRWEKGPLFFQQTVREVITEHYRREKAAGHEIWPARQKIPDDALLSLEDMEICNGISCGTRKEVLVW